MLQYDSYTRDRIRQLVERLRGRAYQDTRPAVELLVSTPAGRITRTEAQALSYRPARLGEQFGPPWTTFWFKVRATVPPEWRGWPSTQSVASEWEFQSRSPGRLAAGSRGGR